MRIKDKVTYRALGLLHVYLKRLSRHAVSKLGARTGSFFFHNFPIRKDVALNNLRLAFPEMNEDYYEQITRQTYCHFGQIFMDVLRADTIDPSRNITVENRHILDEACKQGKGVILLSGHFGNWEMIGVWFAAEGFDLHAVVRGQKNRGANRYFMELRRRCGTFPLYASSPASKMLRSLKNGGILALASDQNAKKKGVFVNFFGKPAATPKGAAVLHLKTGAPIVISICSRNSDGTYHLRFDSLPADEEYRNPVTSVMQNFTSFLEAVVRQNPEQYFWFHKRWKTRPPNSS
ncbi:MAG: lysophospholipid acyltransferase family protein [Candidatus Marinimicrobia bacterium]|nr:lysophospholipid acyltransferase family protein [Candidatus Neomarinimicrobiota bacterium]